MKQLSDEQLEKLSPESRAKYENDLRKVSRNRKILVGLSGAVLAVLILIVLSLTVLFNITSIKVTQAGKTYTADQIIMASGLDVGDNMIRTNFDSAAYRIETSLPYILEAKITKKLSGEVKISVTDTSEAFIVDFGKGDLLVTDKNGKALKTLKEYPEDCKLMKILSASEVFSTIGSDFILSDPDENENYAAIISKLEELGLLEKITEIDLRDQNSLKVVYENRLRLLIGSADNLDTKLRSAAETIKIENENDLTTIAEINLTIPKKVFVNPLASLDPQEEEPEDKEDESVDADGQEDTTKVTDTSDANKTEESTEPTDTSDTTAEAEEETTEASTQATEETSSTTTQAE